MGRRVFLNPTFLPLTICDINSNLVVKFSPRVVNKISALLFSFEYEGMLGFCSSFQEVKEYYFYFQGQEFVKGFK